MNRYARMKRASKSNGGKKQFVDNQKKVVRGVLLLIISTLMIVFVFDPMAIAMVIAINKYIGVGRREEEDSTEAYFRERNKMVYEHTKKNEKKSKEVKDKISEKYDI